MYLSCIVMQYYYMEESVLLGTKPLVESIRHFIRDPSGVFSVCHLCECRIVQWRHDSRLLLLLNWFLHIIKRTLHVSSKIWILCSCGKNNISLVRFAHSCNILYICKPRPVVGEGKTQVRETRGSPPRLLLSFYRCWSRDWKRTIPFRYIKRTFSH